MNRVDRAFADLRARGAKGIMPFICAGYPTIGATAAALPALARAGASVIEVGIPFSDPVADGPVIAGAMHTALEAGVTPASVFDAVRTARDNTDAAIVAMVSCSIAFRVGVERFISDATAAGFDGFIFPDLPAEESGDFTRAAVQHGATLSMLIAPTTSDARLDTVLAHCTGFVYLMARVGVTGSQGASPTPSAPDHADRVAVIRARTDLPIACGFGISTPDQVRQVVRHADAAIVGSALVQRMGRATDPVTEAASFVRDLAAGLK